MDLGRIAFHDREIVAVSLRGPRAVALTFGGVPGGDLTVTFEGLEHLRVEDFGRQNVVSRLLVDHGPDVDAAAFAAGLRWTASLSDAPGGLSPPEIDARLRRVRGRDAALHLFEPSCGATVGIFCGGPVLVA